MNTPLQYRDKIPGVQLVVLLYIPQTPYNIAIHLHSFGPGTHYPTCG